MARISKSTAVVLILLIIGGAGGAIFAIQRGHHRPSADPAQWTAVAEIGPCTRASETEVNALVSIESQTELDGATLPPGGDCHVQAALLARSTNAVAGAKEALERYAKAANDFAKARLDLVVFLDHHTKRVDKGKGKKLVAALAKERDVMLDAEARMQARLDQVYADQIDQLGTLASTQRAALAIAMELETIAYEADKQHPDQDAMIASAKKIATLSAHDGKLLPMVHDGLPWIATLVSTGVLPATADTDTAAGPFWRVEKP